MGIRGSATANQTRLLGHISNVLAVTNPKRLRQRQHALINYTGPPLFFASIHTALYPRAFCFPRYRGSVCTVGRKGRSLRSETIEALVIGRAPRKSFQPRGPMPRWGDIARSSPIPRGQGRQQVQRLLVWKGFPSSRNASASRRGEPRDCCEGAPMTTQGQR